MKSPIVKAVLVTAVVALLVGLRLGAQGDATRGSGAMPPPSIPTFSTDDLGRLAHFYVGGKYVGEPGKEQMDGAMYVEVWVPKQIRQAYPDRDVPRQRSDRRRLATDSRRAARLGILPDQTRLRRLHGGLPRTWPLTLRARR